MPENQNQNQALNSQTLVIDEDQFTFITVEQRNGMATTVRFKLENPEVRPSDVLLILSGSDIRFHGFISKIEDGWATASDRTGSLLPAGIH
jgi:hypothetical protein